MERISQSRLGRRNFLCGLAIGGASGIAIGVLRSQLAANSPEKNMKNERQAPADNIGLDHDRYMRLAIEQARNVPQLPFGAVIVDTRSGEVLAEGFNRSADSPTFHGEIDVINRLAAKGPREDWSPLAIYTTAEPCPMCQGAIEWAGIGLVVYGTSIATLQELDWWQIDIRAAEVIRRTPFRQTRLLAGVLADECDALFRAVPRGKFRKQTEDNR
jgi:tRNA(adenine34) deaminase